jgi:ParB family chromosome partitioning protein
MRHDEHYVSTLSAPAGMPIGRLLPIDQLDPNPDQPRQAMGDLSELMASIAEKGVIEPIVVRVRDGRYQIIAGERRYQAAVQVGLRELPVVVRDVDDGEVIELALIENLQRKDLTAFEEADALHALAAKSNLTHEDLAKRLGKSRTAITESLAIYKMPADVKNLCRLADISSKSLLLQIVRLGDASKMTAMVEKIARDGSATRERLRREAAASKPHRGRPKSYVYSYRPPTKAFKLRLSFAKSQVDRGEIITALEAIIADLKQQQ